MGYGPSTPCDHFGVGTIGNASKTTYSWLVEQTPGSSTLVNEVSNVLAPNWTVTPQAPPAPGVPAPPPVIVAAIEAPEVPEGYEFGEALWVKVFTTEYEDEVRLEDLLGENPLIRQSETETEWQLLQRDSGNPDAALNAFANGREAGANAKSILRRYEFYEFTGFYDPESHEAKFDVGFGDSHPGPNDVGAFLGAQNAALNFGLAPNAAVPEPAAWALMITGFGLAGASLRRRRTLTAA